MKQEILRIENMNVALGDVTVLTNLHLHLFSGELCCILAPSDGSKAGLAAVLSGQRPVNGTVSYCGRPIVRSFHRQYSSGEICCLSKRTQPFRAFSALDWFSVNCCLQKGGFFPSKSRLAAFSYYTSLLGLSLSPSVPVSSLSRFEQQMTALAAGLMNGATLVVFDEAFLSFSNAECAKMQAIIVLLKQRGIAVLYLAAGVDDLACTADQLLILKLGTVVGRLSKAHGFTKQDVLRFYVNVYNPLHVETNQPPLISAPALFTMRNFAIDTLVPFDLSIHARELVSIYCDSNITLDSFTEPPTHIAPEDAAQRTAYWEADLAENRLFGAVYSYRTTARYADPLHMQADPVQPDFDTQEELPHLEFTPYLRALAAQLTQGITDPVQKAKRIYDYVTLNTHYHYQPPYFVQENITDGCVHNRRGDCGIMASTFIVLCRLAGIPAQWQSGLVVRREMVGCHDWAAFYIAPHGWMYADCSAGASMARAGNEKMRLHYFGNLDTGRMVANRALCAPFDPPMCSFRADPCDNQVGEVEADGVGLYGEQLQWSQTLRRYETL